MIFYPLLVTSIPYRSTSCKQDNYPLFASLLVKPCHSLPCKYHYLMFLGDPNKPARLIPQTGFADLSRLHVFDPYPSILAPCVLWDNTNNYEYVCDLHLRAREQLPKFTSCPRYNKLNLFSLLIKYV